MKIIKNAVLIVSGLIGGGDLIVNYIGTFEVCNNRFTCVDQLVATMWLLFPAISLFLFSLITYKLPERTFRSWFYGLVVWWIPLSMVLIAIAPATSHTFIPDPFTKGPVAFASSILFAIISLIIVLVSYLRNRKKVQQVVGK